METFQGYPRANGLVGVRNYVAVLPSVACANGVVAAISREVPEVVPLLHGCGCGRGGSDHELHDRTLRNLCGNPNIAGVLIVGLGCEILGAGGLELAAVSAGKPVRKVMIQEEGGSRKTAAKGASLARELLAEVAEVSRREFTIDGLTVGLECGGSDAFSGVTANPAVGLVSDRLVDLGATVILTETTEMIGTSHILERRAVNEKVKRRIFEIIDRQEKKTQEILGPLAKLAISPGNMDGGMSCIQEKSLGCITKAGSRPFGQVVEYAERPAEKGLVIMNGPGYDTDSLTGLAAAGAQVIIFTTGRGNPIGFPVVPVIKVASTSRVYHHLEDDLDVNAGVVLEGHSLGQVGDQIYDCLRRVIEGEPTKAEINQQGGILCLYSQNTSF